jgi:DNA-binding transcriptional regulator YiaG
MKGESMGTCRCGGRRISQPIKEFKVNDGLLGIENVTLVGDSVTEDVCEACGNRKIHIPDLPGLIAAVAITRAKHPYKLNAKEIRFLHKAIDIPSIELAALMEVTPETISRWESGKNVMTASNEKLFRVIVVVKLQYKASAVEPDLELITSLNIQPVYSGGAPEMVLARVPTKVERKKTEPLWTDEGQVLQVA